MKQKFYFVVSKIPPEGLENSNPDFPSKVDGAVGSENAHLWGTHEWNWLIQTFLQTKAAGLDVALVDKPVANAICITHFVTTKDKVWGKDSFIVGIRSDTPPIRMKEFEIVQSPAVLSGKNAAFINHWPQSKLFPRNTARRNRVETISYFGGQGGLSPDFYSEHFQTSLRQLGVSLNLNFQPSSWGNYDSTDLVLAVRHHHHPTLIKTKPASKLINSWQAGCVALLGREPAYRAVGTPGQNYFEIETPQDALETIAKLREHSGLYESVRKAGIDKYREYSFQALQQQWVELLTGPITEAFIQWQNKNEPKLKKYAIRYCQAAQQWIDHKLFSLPIRATEFLEHMKHS
ncbi:MAG: hypothetical protein AAFQ40_09690 [Cyanobacteria bacterium J06623_5]